MTIEKISRMNDYMTTVLMIAYLNLLWVGGTLLGLVFFGVGPATYAMMNYYDRWLRLGEQPPIARTFWNSYKERYRQSLLISWLLMIIGTILIVNIFTLHQWYYQVANVLVLIVVLIGSTHIYTIMSATTFDSILAIIRGSALLGLGYLHYSIISWTVIIVSYLIASRLSLALVFIWGIGFMGFILGYTGKIILKDFTPIQIESS